jgi:hypothetical protein
MQIMQIKNINYLKIRKLQICILFALFAMSLFIIKPRCKYCKFSFLMLNSLINRNSMVIYGKTPICIPVLDISLINKEIENTICIICTICIQKYIQKPGKNFICKKQFIKQSKVQ